MSDGKVVADSVEGENIHPTGTRVERTRDRYEVYVQVGPAATGRPKDSGAESCPPAQKPRTVVVAPNRGAGRKPTAPLVPGREPATGERPGALVQAAIFGCQFAGWSALYLGLCLVRAAWSGGAWQTRDVLVVLFASVIGALGWLAQRRTATSPWLPFVSLLLAILIALLIEINRAPPIF